MAKKLIKKVAGKAIKKNGNKSYKKATKDKNEKLVIENPYIIDIDKVASLKSHTELIDLLHSKNGSAKSIISTINYEIALQKLQVELVKLQRWAQDNNKKIAILFEGRDAAGKGGAIRRFIEHLNPRSMRVVALPKPSEIEKGQWYFQRYVSQLPNEGEIVFFDRSWYNRAVVEPVNGFCTIDEYLKFMKQVVQFENMLLEDNIILVKFWFSISKEEQLNRLNQRKTDLLKQWKISPLDDKAQALWIKYTKYKEEMFNKTHTEKSPWIIVKANNKKRARLESIKYLLNVINYTSLNGKKYKGKPDPDILQPFHVNSLQID